MACSCTCQSPTVFRFTFFEHSNGILDADYIFTILTRPIMGFLGESGKRSSIYIVDLINFHQTEKGCADQKIFILKNFPSWRMVVKA